jgi:hypothetical protein
MPAKTGIQKYQVVTGSQDRGFLRNDDFFANSSFVKSMKFAQE